MENNFSFTVLIPPICILCCACLTRKIIFSLIIGIILATLIAKNFHIIAALQLAYQCFITNLEFNKFFSYEQFWEAGSLFICIFLLILGIFVVLLQQSGSAHAYASFIKKHLHNKRSVETSSLILSFCLFIDDYFNSLTVGSIMSPLTDINKIPRVKLAFLVHSLSSPLVILCPISSWMAAILGYLSKYGISNHLATTTFILANPMRVYFALLPFIFYSIILIISICYTTRMSLSFGLMKKYENIAETTGNLFGGKEIAAYLKELPVTKPLNNPGLIDFFFPIITLIFALFASMLYSGNWQYFGGQNCLFQALQNTSAATALFLGGNYALIISIIFLVSRQQIKITALPKIFFQGIQLMLPSIITLMLAWTFGEILSTQLHTGEYLANLLVRTVDLTMLPTLLFLTATIIAGSIGTAWGTAAMLFPIAIPMVPALLGIQHTPSLNEVPILIPVLGAILSGCVAGNHISPIADTTIMSATSTRTPIMDHLRTQLPYAVLIILATAISFIIAAHLIPYGFIIAATVPLITGILLAIIMLHILHNLKIKNKILL